MVLTLLSFFALAIAGFGVCEASTRRLKLPTNALINLGLGFFVATAVVGFIISHSWLPISTVSQAILLVSCLAAAITAVDFNQGSTLSLSAAMPRGSRLTWFNAMCLCLIAGYLMPVSYTHLTLPTKRIV